MQRKCESFDIFPNSRRTYCKRYSRVEEEIEIPCPSLQRESHNTNRGNRYGPRGKSQIAAIVSSYQNYNNILENEGEEAAKEYITEERNKVCEAKIRKIVSRLGDCPGVGRARSWLRRLNAMVQNVSEIIERYGVSRYYGIRLKVFKSSQLGARSYVLYEEKRCNNSRRISVERKIQRELYGPECLQLQEAGVLTQYQAAQGRTQSSKGWNQTLNKLGITAQSYCENNKLGCN
jgi:hypothetical protein